MIIRSFLLPQEFLNIYKVKRVFAVQLSLEHTQWAIPVNENMPLLRNTFAVPPSTSNCVNFPLKMQLNWRQ